MPASLPDARTIQFAVALVNNLRDREYGPRSFGSFEAHAMDWGWVEQERKDAVPLFSPVTLKRGETARRASSVETVNAMVLDFDKGEHSADDICEMLKPLGFWGHTTHSHTEEVPKFRVIIPLTAPVPSAQWSSFWKTFIKEMKLPADRQCSDPCRIYYLPSHRPGLRWGDYYEFAQYGCAIDTELYMMLAREEAKRKPLPMPGIVQRLSRPHTGVDWQTFDPILFLDSHGIEWERRPDKIWCYCPWRNNHSHPAEDNINDAYFHWNNGKIGFHCSHSHCDSKWIGTIMHELDGEAFCEQPKEKR